MLVRCKGIAKRQVESKTGNGKKAITREGKLNGGEYDRNHALAERNLSPKIIIPLLLTLARTEYKVRGLYNPVVFTMIQRWSKSNGPTVVEHLLSTNLLT